MKKLPKIILGSMAVIALLLACGLQEVKADDISSIGIATYMPIEAKVEDGDIISLINSEYSPSNKMYDQNVIGVVTNKPAIALKIDGNKKATVPVVNIGTVLVKVTGTNGDIKKGDYITTSTTKGVGIKATKSGYILGQAMDSVTFKNKTDVKKVILTLNLHFFQIGSPANNSLWDIFALSQLAAYEEPVRVFKYVVSALVLVISFGFGFLIFSRAINTGIQALGRNPLAGRMIQLSILFNVVLVIIIIMSGIGIVWLFLRL